MSDETITTIQYFVGYEQDDFIFLRPSDACHDLDWRAAEALAETVRAGVRSGELVVRPFANGWDVQLAAR